MEMERRFRESDLDCGVILLRLAISKAIAGLRTFTLFLKWCPWPDSNRHALRTTDFESVASTNSATGAVWKQPHYSDDLDGVNRPSPGSNHLVGNDN